MKQKTTKKTKIKNLRDLYYIKEDLANLVATQAPQEDDLPMKDISVDEKIDHFIISYEKESLPLSQEFQKEEAKSKLSLKSLMHKLFEAANEPGDEPEEEDPLGNNDMNMAGMGGGGANAPSGGGLGNDLGGGDPGGGGNVQKGPAPVPTPKINISNFAKNVARLVNDYQSLMDVKRIILNRTKVYIQKNYNQEVAKELMDILDTEYNLSTTTQTEKDTETPVSFAIGALEPIGGSE